MIDRQRALNAYLQDSNNYSTASNLNSMNDGTVSYATGKEACLGNIIRTNLNNIDYATNGTIYRRPQLHPSLYEPANNTKSSELSSLSHNQPARIPPTNSLIHNNNAMRINNFSLSGENPAPNLGSQMTANLFANRGLMPG